MISVRAASYDQWRDIARHLLSAEVRPQEIVWSSEPGLFGTFTPSAKCAALTLPRSFVQSAEIVARNNDDSRWGLLYRIAWRILNENHNLMVIDVDDDIRRLAEMRKSVETDIYKMRAFVRFRRTVIDGGEQFIAWYAPDHDTLEANEKFFVDRFGGMRWAILTPRGSMSWDLEKVHKGPGVPRSEAPGPDELESVFRSYWSAIYNPARLNIPAMQAQMPVRRWKDLPEAQAIATLIRESRERVQTMAANQPSATSLFVPRTSELPMLAQAVRTCGACELCSRATQPVFGEGPATAGIVLVGEQPGDEEDRGGRPFIGPAGQVLDNALRAAGLDRNQLYVTNAVKAFRFVDSVERGKRRIHQTPKAIHISTCRPWLEAEIACVKPQAIVCLGATAAQSVLGRSVPIGQARRQTFSNGWAQTIQVTYHPSAILRAPVPAAQQQFMQALVEDLEAVKAAVSQLPRVS